MSKSSKYDATREFIDALTEIIAEPHQHVLDKVILICTRLRRSYVPSEKYVLRQKAVRDVVEMHHRGMPVRLIIEKTGLKKSTVYKIIKDQNGGISEKTNTK